MSEYDFGDGKGMVPAHQHVNGGGWVAETAHVAATAFVSPKSKVFGKAKVIFDASLLGESEVADRAFVFDRASLTDSIAIDDARVFGGAHLDEGSVARGHGVVCGEARLRKASIVEGHAHVTGSAGILAGAHIRGAATILGSVTLVGGSHSVSPVFGRNQGLKWVSYQGETDAEPVLQLSGHLRHNLQDYAVVRGWEGLVAGLLAHFGPALPPPSATLCHLQLRNLEHFLQGSKAEATVYPLDEDRDRGPLRFYFHPEGANLVRVDPFTREGLLEWECSCESKEVCFHAIDAAHALVRQVRGVHQKPR
jgi:hypothetical protein